MLLLISITFLLIVLLYRHLTKYNNYWKKRNVPGPAPSFFFGNIKDLVLRRKEASEIYKDIYDQYPDEKFVGIFRMRTPTLLVKDLEIIKHILIKDFNVFMDREPQFGEKGLGANLFHAGKDTWQMLRNRFTPIFTTGKLKNMMYILTESGDKLVEYVDTLIEDQPEQEIHGIVKKYTIETIAACAFGLNMDTYKAHCQKLNDLERKIFMVDHRAELDMMYPKILKRLDVSIMPEDVRVFFTNLTKEIIDQRNGNPTGRNDFMDLLLELRKEKRISNTATKDIYPERIMDITDDIIAGQTFIFYTAGYQTTATTISYMLCHLANDHVIQNKVVAEIEAVLKTNKGKLTYEAVSDLKYMDQVFSETLRMHPVVYSVRRVAGMDYRVPGTDLTVKKGQVIIIPINILHMDPKNFPNPEVFDPERFSAKNAGARHFCAYMPFGNGLRQCIGLRFAKLQSKLCMVKLLSRFRVELSRDTPKRFYGEAGRMVNFPIGGFPLKLVRRHGITNKTAPLSRQTYPSE